MAQSICRSPYQLTQEQVSRFKKDGVLGPLACDAPEVGEVLPMLESVSLPSAAGGRRNVYDPQLRMAVIHQLASHPSLVHPIAQLLGCNELSFFQARFRAKAPGVADSQPWHQDVGPNHGGLFDDGTPIPSLTVWLSLDGADADSGAVVLLPGTHRSLLGNWQAGFHGLRSLQDSLDTSQARTLATAAGHFHIFHSWVVHCSLTNNSRKPRSALILRYMDRRHAVRVSFPHYPCGIC